MKRVVVGYPKWTFWALMAGVALAGYASRGWSERITVDWPRLAWVALEMVQKALMGW